MASIDFKKIAKAVLETQAREQKIRKYKDFYREHLKQIKNPKQVLSLLYQLVNWFNNYKYLNAFDFSKERLAYERKVDTLLDEYFNPTIKILYKKQAPPIKTSPLDREDLPVWQQFLVGLLNVPKEIEEKHRKEWENKGRFLNFLYDCLYFCGLPPEVNERDAAIYKRYNVVIEHNFKIRKLQTEVAFLLSGDKLQSDFLGLYFEKKPILLDGKLVPHKSIYKCKITSTLLLDDEVELFAKQQFFSWTSQQKDKLSFANKCFDETELLLKNPHSKRPEVNYRNGAISFIDPIRIEELEKCKSREFDLTKLIQLCKETNQSSINSSFMSVSLSVRAIIDHVPPIFGFKNFSEIANNYKGGTRSFKEVMQKLDTSLRKIADNNIHSQVRSKEVKVNKVQVDFSQELDVLLGEIVRILK